MPDLPTLIGAAQRQDELRKRAERAAKFGQVVQKYDGASKDEAALIHFASRFLLALPNVNSLPPGPWTRTKDLVEDASGRAIAITGCPSSEMNKSRAVCQLLIAAEAAVRGRG